MFSSSILPADRSTCFAKTLRCMAALVLTLLLASCGMTDVRLDPTVDAPPTPVTDEVADPVTDADPDTSNGPENAPASLGVIVAGHTAEPGGAFDVIADDSATAGRHLAQPASIPASTTGTQIVSTPFTTEVEGEYSLWVRLRGPDTDSDAVYLGFDGAMHRKFTSQHGVWTWVHVTRQHLPAGPGHIGIGYGEPGLQIDVFVIVADESIGATELEAYVVDGTTPDDTGRPETPDDSPTTEDPADTTPPPAETEPSRASYSLRGDPSFSVSRLTPEQRRWYDGFLADVANEGGSRAMTLAGRDDIYQYGRTLHTYVQSVLTVFRMTGDLRLLDHVDQIAERMRRELRDGWRDTLDGTDGTRDGYLNWAYRYGNSTMYQGKDTIQIDEMNTHGLVASFAYALHANRDLTSPGGRSYAASADFWRDYLVNHFEAKWRERRNVASGFPIMTRPHIATYYSWIKWHYYMGKLTGNDAYSREATRMADILWSEVRTASTPTGPAFVWSRSVISLGGSQEALQPTTYARYAFGDTVEFHFEGFHNWAHDGTMRTFARTLTEFVIDTNDPVRNGFARDIGGGRAQAGLESDPNWKRMDIEGYRISAYALIGAWDRTDRVNTINRDIQHRLSSKDTTLLTSALFVDSWLGSEAAATTMAAAR